jgi:hypothetical protein
VGKVCRDRGSLLSAPSAITILYSSRSCSIARLCQARGGDGRGPGAAGAKTARNRQSRQPSEVCERQTAYDPQQDRSFDRQNRVGLARAITFALKYQPAKNQHGCEHGE